MPTACAQDRAGAPSSATSHGAQSPAGASPVLCLSLVQPRAREMSPKLATGALSRASPQSGKPGAERRGDGTTVQRPEQVLRPETSTSPPRLGRGRVGRGEQGGEEGGKRALDPTAFS